MRVSGAMLKEVLCLPAGTEIRPVWVEFEVEHPDIPEDADMVNPSFRQHERVEFLGWNPLRGGWVA